MTARKEGCERNGRSGDAGSEHQKRHQGSLRCKNTTESFC